MDCHQYPWIKTDKYVVPTIYLDTCVMIQLSKYENGTCKDVHKQEIGELYDILMALMQKNRIYCPLGNQLQEMGMTKEREPAKQFLYRFTNSELQHPDLICNAEMKAGYQAFINNDEIVKLDVHTAFKENTYAESPFVIHVAPVYSPEKAESLRQEKLHIVTVLNEMKASKKVKSGFEAQLIAELESEYLSFLGALENPMASEKACMRYLDELSKFYRITGASANSDPEVHINNLARYSTFLLSAYHDRLPFIWIRASLWAHLMQRSNKIVRGDNLDITWAAAYLPFVDYAVTDHAFCELLYSSGLAELYGVKVYSLKTLKTLLDNLKCL